MEEIWKEIDDFNGDYLISNIGNVKSLKNNKEIILKPRLDKKYYLLVNLSKNGKLLTFRVHRLVAIAFIPNPENKPEVNHKNSIRNDNRLLNLEWATPKENTEHSVKNKRWNRSKGENNKTSKLTWISVKEIRELKISNLKISKLYNVSESTIASIKNNKTWII